LRLLDWSESTAVHFIVVAILAINRVGSAGWDAHLLASGLDCSFTYTFLLDWFMNCLEHCVAIIATVLVLSCGWEESLFVTLTSFVLCGVECSILLLRINGSSRACCNACYMCCISCVAIFTFYWFYYWIIQIDHKIVINGVFFWWFRFSNRMDSLSICASSLSSSVESSNSLIWRIELLRILFVNWSMLDSLIIEWVVSILLNGLDWRAYELIHQFSAVFGLLRVQRSCHVKVLFLLGTYLLSWWVIGTASIISYKFCFI